jgi:ribose-phosphate pyrophosphokinase
MDLHAGQIQGFFNIPVDELTAVPILTDYIKSKELDNLVVVAVDIGISKRARDVAERLNVPLAII